MQKKRLKTERVYVSTYQKLLTTNNITYKYIHLYNYIRLWITMSINKPNMQRSKAFLCLEMLACQSVVILPTTVITNRPPGQQSSDYKCKYWYFKLHNTFCSVLFNFLLLGCLGVSSMGWIGLIHKDTTEMQMAEVEGAC